MMTIQRVDTGQVASFEVVRADFSPEASATEHPVELGSEVTDHVQVRSLRFSVEAYVTESPLASPGQVGLPGALERARVFFEGAHGKLLTVTIDGEGTFASCVLEAYPHARAAPAGRVFALRFRQVRISSAISVPIPPRVPAPAAGSGAPTEQPLGNQATTPAPVQGSSFLFEVGSLFGAF